MEEVSHGTGYGKGDMPFDHCAQALDWAYHCIMARRRLPRSFTKGFNLRYGENAVQRGHEISKS